MYLQIYKSVLITSPTGFDVAFTNVEDTLKQGQDKLYQRCFNVVSITSDTDIVSMLCNVENPVSDFVSFSTLDQHYFNVDPQSENNIDPTLKCWLSIYRKKIYLILSDS